MMSASHKASFALLLFVKYFWPTYAGSRTNKKKEIFKSHKKYSFHIVENNTSVSNLGKEFSRSRCYIKTLIYKKYL